MLKPWSTLLNLIISKKVKSITAQNRPSLTSSDDTVLKKATFPAVQIVFQETPVRRTEVIIVAQWLERLKRAMKKPAVKRVTFPQHHNGAYVPWRQHDVPKIPDLHLHCARARAGEELPARLRSHSNYTVRPQHAGSRAQPAVRNRHACCAANGYGCRQCVEEAWCCMADQSDGGARAQ